MTLRWGQLASLIADTMSVADADPVGPTKEDAPVLKADAVAAAALIADDADDGGNGDGMSVVGGAGPHG